MYFGTGSQQSEVASAVLVAVRSLFRQHRYKLLWCTGNVHSPLPDFVLKPESDFLIRDLYETVLRDGRSAHVPAGISQEVLFQRRQDGSALLRSSSESIWAAP